MTHEPPNFCSCVIDDAKHDAKSLAGLHQQKKKWEQKEMDVDPGRPPKKKGPYAEPQAFDGPVCTRPSLGLNTFGPPSGSFSSFPLFIVPNKTSGCFLAAWFLVFSVSAETSKAWRTHADRIPDKNLPSQASHLPCDCDALRCAHTHALRRRPS